MSSLGIRLLFVCLIVFPFPAIKDNEYNEYIDVYKVVEFNEVRSGR